MSAMIDIEPSSIIKHPHAGKHCTAAKRSLPFAESLQGEYTHRVRHVTLYVTLYNDWPENRPPIRDLLVRNEPHRERTEERPAGSAAGEGRSVRPAGPRYRRCTHWRAGD